MELKGEFIPEVFDEDKQFLDKIKPSKIMMMGISRDSKNPTQNFLNVPGVNNFNIKEHVIGDKRNSVYSIMSQNSSLSKNEVDFSDMNLAKLEREVLMKFKERKLGINRKFKTGSSTLLRSPSFNLQNFGSLESNEGDNDILEKMDVSRKYKLTDFLVDFFYKKTQIKELIEALSVCHEARIIEGTRVLKSFNNEEKSILSLCKKLGISIEATNITDSQNEDLTCVYKIKENGKKVAVIKVLGINSFSKKRGRMSVLVQKLDEDFCTLYVKGNDYSMKDIIKMTDKDRITFKQMIMNYRAKGLKNIVIAKKVLKKTDYKAFLINYRLVSKMTRNQQENFEKLALGIEKDLELLGCLGIKNNIEPGVERLVENMQKAEIKISMLTGDFLENSLMVAKQLKLSTNDFNDASSFYSFRFKSQREAISKTRRIVEYLYQKLKLITINEKKKSTDRDYSSTYESFTSSPSMKRLRFARSRMFNSTSQIILKKKFENDEWKKQREDLFKPLLINGNSIDIMVTSPYLRKHFKFILYFCNNIIGYSLESKHKKFIVRCLKETSSGMIMAVGDGFNDMTMMREADLGVQLAHRDVPLMFGDIVLNDLSILNYLIFVRGKRIYSNLILAEIWFMSFVPSMTIYLFLLDTVSFFSTELSGSLFKFGLGIVLAPIFVVTFASTKTFSGKILAEIPEFYLERRVINQSYLPVSIMAIMVSVFDSLVVFCSAYFIFRDFTSEEGFNFYKEVVSVYGFFSFLIIGILKIQALSLRRSNTQFIYGIIVIIILLSYFILNKSVQYSLTLNFPLAKILRFKEFYFSLCYSLILLGISNYVIGLLINKNFLHPLYFESMNHIIRENFSHFQSGENSELKSYAVQERKMNLTMFIKKIFNKDTRTMDSFLKKIMTLDSSSFTFGLDWLTCKIKDNAENKRYQIYKRNWETSHYRKFLSLTWITVLLDLIFLLFSSDSPYGFLDIENTYILLFFFLPMVSSFASEQRKLLSSYMKLATLASVSFVFLCKFIINSNGYKPPFFILIRFLQGPAMIEYVMGSLGIIVCTIFETARWVINSSIHGFDFEASVRIKNAVDLILICIAKNFLADDAGEVTILFCDICQFNDVMKDCSEKIIQIIDDVFRYFDYLCKQNGIQKIETVGKTYMACGGLKFIEEKLDKSLKEFTPTKRILDLALGMMGYIDKFTYDAGKKLELKIGIHKGNCSYGVLGYHKPQFSLIGDTVNTTSRHCTTGPDSRIILSIQAHEALVKAGEDIQYKFLNKLAKMKGKGMIKTFIVIRDIDTLKMKKRISIRPEVLDNVYDQRRRKSRFQSHVSLQELDADNIRKILDKEDKIEEENLGSVSIEDNSISMEINSEDSAAFEQSLSYYNDLDELVEENKDSNRENILAKEGNGGESPGLKANMGKNQKNNQYSNLNKNNTLTTSIDTKEMKFHLMTPFGKNKQTFEKYFLKQMIMKNKNKIALCVNLLLFEKVASITQNLLRTDQYQAFWTSGIIQILICAAILIFIIFSRTITAIREPLYSKIFLGGIFIFVSGTRILQCVLTNINDQTDSYIQKREEQNFDLVFLFMLETILINISGLFYFKDVLIYNITFGVITIGIMAYFNTPTTAHRIFSIIEIIVFNLTDAHFSFTRELNGINNLVVVEKKSLQLSQFVNRLLPKHIHETINKPSKKIGEYYEDVTLLYADIVGFTSYSNKHSSRQVVAMLSSLFTDFDKECNRLGLFKIYTIGDCYVVMSFLDKNNRRSPKEEANAVTQMGISMIRIINDVRKKLKIDLNMRIGIHTGDIYGGVIGTDLVRFDLYGADVVIANKMESKGTPGRINVSEDTKLLLESLETCNYSFEFNKQVDLEGLDVVLNCYLLNYEYDVDENKEDLM